MRETRPNFAVKKCLNDTLRQLKPNQTIFIKERDFKYPSIRTAKYQLLKEGIVLEVSQRGLIGETRVTRLA